MKRIRVVPDPQHCIKLIILFVQDAEDDVEPVVGVEGGYVDGMPSTGNSETALTLPSQQVKFARKFPSSTFSFHDFTLNLHDMLLKIKHIRNVNNYRQTDRLPIYSINLKFLFFQL